MQLRARARGKQRLSISTIYRIRILIAAHALLARVGCRSAINRRLHGPARPTRISMRKYTTKRRRK